MRALWRAAIALATSAALVAIPLGAAAAGPYPPKAATCAVTPAAGRPGTPIRVVGQNWQVGGSVSVVMLRSGVRPLGSAIVAPGGAFMLQTRVPFVRPGRAIIRVVGKDASGNRSVCMSRFRVLPKKHVAMSPTSSSPSADPGLTTGGIITLVGLGAALLIVRRRRGRSLFFGRRHDPLAAAAPPD
jgi:MYXO-CTERM domain-containing protein